MFNIKNVDRNEERLIINEKHAAYASEINFSISSSEKTLINSCFFNLISLDQIGALFKYNDKANNGKSLLCGDKLLDSRIYFLYSDFGTNFTIFFINKSKNSNSELESSEDFIICFFNPLISKNTKSGETNLYPICLNFLISRNTLDLLKKENKIFVSNIRNIFYSCNLATLSFTSSENSLASLSESLDLEAIASPILNSNSSSISSCKVFSIALLTNLSNSKFFEIDNISLSNSSGILIDISAIQKRKSSYYIKLSKILFYLSPTANSFIITNSTNDPICYFNSTGSILLLGTINQTSALNVLTTTNFEIRNSSNNLVAVIDNKGSLHLQGRFVERYESP